MPISTLTAEKVAKLMQEQEKKAGTKKVVALPLRNSAGTLASNVMMHHDLQLLKIMAIWTLLSPVESRSRPLMEFLPASSCFPLGARVAELEAKEAFGSLVGGASFQLRLSVLIIDVP